MISRLTIENFQSYRRAEIEFDPGVNVIIGPTDAGKSAIARSIKWAARNRPRGTDFRSDWAKECTVKLDVDEEYRIIRQRTKSENLYKLIDLNDSNGAEMEFKAVASEVPDEIQNVLKLEDLNFQTQIDPFFMLQSSPGEVARFLNEIAGLQEIDTVSKNLDKYVKQKRSDQASAERQKHDLEKELEKYQDLEQIEKNIRKAEKLEKRAKEYEDEITWIQGKLSRIRDLEERTKGKRKIKKAKLLITKASNFQKAAEEKGQEIRNIDKISNQIANKDAQISKNKQELTKLEKQFWANMPKICPLCGCAHKEEK